MNYKIIRSFDHKGRSAKVLKNEHVFQIIRAISDPTRLKILINMKNGEVCACNFPTCCGVSQPAVSQHLKTLLQTRLVRVRREGIKRLYSITAKGSKVLKDINNW